jgi:hypothetical protein|tara:strand:+ start:58450 stop:58602 length:153 start_codon:yes stop_codon:yes gene_type:complete
MNLKELIEKYGEDLEVYFLVHSCGQTSEFKLEESDIEEREGKLIILSDLN